MNNVNAENYYDLVDLNRTIETRRAEILQNPELFMVDNITAINMVDQIASSSWGTHIPIRVCEEFSITFSDIEDYFDLSYSAEIMYLEDWYEIEDQYSTYEKRNLLWEYIDTFTDALSQSLTEHPVIDLEEGETLYFDEVEDSAEYGLLLIKKIRE